MSQRYNDQMRAMGELPYELRLEQAWNRLKEENARLKAELAQCRKDYQQLEDEHYYAWSIHMPDFIERAARLREVLRELYAVVRGECPSLLNEDSGGDAELSLEIERALEEDKA